jgi:hypothetical protein
MSIYLFPQVAEAGDEYWDESFGIWMDVYPAESDGPVRVGMRVLPDMAVRRRVGAVNCEGCNCVGCSREDQVICAMQHSLNRKAADMELSKKMAVAAMKKLHDRNENLKDALVEAGKIQFRQSIELARLRRDARGRTEAVPTSKPPVYYPNIDFIRMFSADKQWWADVPKPKDI